MPASVKPTAEPFHREAGTLGVLLSHGFTGSPASMRPWAEFLADRGYSVSVPRLPGHGTEWRDLNRTTWADWYGELDAAMTELLTRCDRIALCGLSMGGGLALRLTEDRPDDVAALILVNPAIGVRNWQLRFLPVLKRLVPSMPGIGNDIKKAGVDEYGYDRTPLRALHSQLGAWPGIQRDLAKVTAPLLVFRATDDHVVDETSLSLIKAGVSSPVAEFVTLHDSYHVATLDNDAPLIFETSAAFLGSHLGVPT